MRKIIVLICWFFQAAAFAAGAPTFKLVTPSEVLAPGETVGVKFSSRMNEEPTEVPPILVEPGVPYAFEWTSPSTASIRFLSALDLGQKLRFEARAGLKDLSGRIVEAPPVLERTRSTPDFALLQVRINGVYNPGSEGREASLAANASVRVTFNDDVRPEALRLAARFVSDDGRAISVGSVEKAPRHSFQERLLTWKEKASNDPAPAVLAFTDGSNDWVVFPREPLSEGKRWACELDLGLINPAAQTGPERKRRISMGEVVPLEIRSAQISKKPLEKAELVLKCSKWVLPQERTKLLTATTLVTPQVPELNVQVTSAEIRINGDFQAGVTYQIRLERGLRALDGTVSRVPFEAQVRLEPLPPRLYFDHELVRQLASGGRQVALMGVNVPQARVTAHLIPPEKGWQALERWKEYRSESFDEEKGAKLEGVRVDPTAFEARLVYEGTVGFDYSQAQEAQVSLNWDQILGKDRTGFVLLTAEEIPTAGKPPVGVARRGVQTLVQLTDIGLELFAGRGGPGFCFAYSLRDSAPMAGVRCCFFNAKREKIGEVETGPDGSVSVPFPGAAWVEATRGEDQVTVLFDANFWAPDSQDVDAAKAVEATRPRAVLKGFVFSDRDLYRPGETLHAKVMVRQVCAGGLQIPRGMRFRVLLEGDRGEQLLDEEVELNGAGAWTLSKELPRRTGGYTLSIRNTESDFSVSHTVSVAEFQPDAFRISLTAPPTLQVPSTFSAGISAAYLSGQSVTDGLVRWELHETPAEFTSAAYDGVEFGVRLESSLREALWPSFPREASSGELKLSASGTAEFSRNIEGNARPPGPRDMVFQTEITDLNNQTLSKSHQFVAHSSDFYLGLKLPKHWFNGGVPVPVQLVAVNSETILPVDLAEPVELVLKKVIWSTSVTRTASGEVKKAAARVETVQKTRVRPQVPRFEAGRWVMKKDQFDAEFRALPPGQYVLEAHARDERRRAVFSTVQFDVAKTDTPNGSLADSERAELSVAPDRDLYHPGETAHILVRTNNDGLALATFQQESVKRHWLIPITKDKPYFEFPIQAADAPGGVLDVHLLRGASQSKLKHPMPEVVTDDVVLRVEPTDARLKVSISGVPTEARPGSWLNPVVHVLGSDGKPAAGADVTLYAVHEGVLQMTGYTTPEPVGGIYPMSFGRMRWRSSLWALRHEAAEPEYANKGYLVGSEGKGGSGSDLRGNFKLNALWIGSASTGADGTFSAAFEVPDYLAKFRVMAVVSHGPQSFGSGEAGFRVNKPLQIQSGVPQFANRGDQLRLRCLVQNAKAQAMTVEVSLDADSAIRLDGSTKQTVTVPAKTSVAVDFPATFTGIGTAGLRWRARALDDSETDGVRESIEVGWPVPALHENRVQRIEKGSSSALEDIQPALLAGKGRANVTVCRSPLIGFQGAVNGLLSYPYGCAEQTVSRLFPWVLAADLKLPGADPDKRAAVIEEGLTRLFSMQLPDGSIGYWPRNESNAGSGVQGTATGHPWCSAYAALLVALVEKDPDSKISTLVPVEWADKLRGYLKAWLTKPSNAALAASYSGQSLAAYALALAGRPEPGAHERLLDSAHLLGADDRSLLAMAVHLSGGHEKTVRMLLDTSVRGPGLDYFSSPSRDVAMALLAGIQTGAPPAQVDALFAEITPRKAGIGSATTQERAWLLYAASMYAKSLPPQQLRSAGAWREGGIRREFNLTENHPFEEAGFSWNGADSSQDLKIENLSEAPLYSFTAVTSYPEREQPAQQSGYILNRKFEKIDANGVASPATDLRVGDRVRVILELSALQNGRYLAIDCPLPAVLEPVQRFAQGDSARAEEDAFADYTEIHADRVLFFKDEVRAGSYRITHITRVRAEGEAVAPAARAEEMYRPERFAQTTSQKLVVR